MCVFLAEDGIVWSGTEALKGTLFPGRHGYRLRPLAHLTSLRANFHPPASGAAAPPWLAAPLKLRRGNFNQRGAAGRGLTRLAELSHDPWRPALVR